MSKNLIRLFEEVMKFNGEEFAKTYYGVAITTFLKDIEYIKDQYGVDLTETEPVLNWLEEGLTLALADIKK